jgi:ribosomal protein L11 methylase PrmA
VAVSITFLFGRMLASGIFIDREPEVRAAFEGAGLGILERTGEGDWVALDVERPMTAGAAATADRR